MKWRDQGRSERSRDERLFVRKIGKSITWEPGSLANTVSFFVWLDRCINKT